MIFAPSHRYCDNPLPKATDKIQAQNHGLGKLHHHIRSIRILPPPDQQRFWLHNPEIPRESSLPHTSHKTVCTHAANYFLHPAVRHLLIMYPHNLYPAVQMAQGQYPKVPILHVSHPYAQYSSDIPPMPAVSYRLSKRLSVLPLHRLFFSLPLHNTSPAYTVLRYEDTHRSSQHVSPFPALPAHNSLLPAHMLPAYITHPPWQQVPYCNDSLFFHPIQRFEAHVPDTAGLPHTA